MSKILFTDAQVKKLSKNKWIKNITNKGITYTDEFKYKLVKECENYKKFPQDVFRECGINPEIVGERRISNSAHRWRKLNEMKTPEEIFNKINDIVVKRSEPSQNMYIKLKEKNLTTLEDVYDEFVNTFEDLINNKND